MSVPAFDKKDEAVGPSPCCKGYLLRRSVPCNADYCENCDTWATEPRVVPHTLGPSWQCDADGRFIRPAHTLGPQIARWVKEYIKSPDGTGAFVFSPEQLRLLYWIYAVDDSGRWVYRELTIQRLKGWGKDPFAALLALIEMVGPCRFSRWDEGGNPVGRPEYNAWVQVMAVSKDQTKNTMRMFAVLASEKLKRDYNVVIGKEQMTALRGQRLVEAVTSSPETREGNRPTFQIGNEALALDTPIPTPTGWTTMGTLSEGDEVFGADGSPTRVVRALPTRLDTDCYRVTFKDGTSMIASDDHRWLVRPNVNVKWHVRTTREMFQDGRRFFIPRPGARQTPGIDLPVDPYLLGLWLGDGSSGQSYIASGDEDVEQTREELAKRGIPTHAKRGTNAWRIGISKKVGFGGDGGTEVSKALRALACYRGEKHIPDLYLAAGTEQRLELLRGLMDSDGCATAEGKCIFVGRRRLSEDAVVLLRSLGQHVRMNFAPDARSKEGGSWRIHFVASGIQPFSLPRKAAKVKQATRSTTPIVSIEPVDSVPVRCIEVEAEDHLFQAGESGMVTHNCHHWRDNNSGHDMRGVMDRNLKQPASRILWITNAYNPAEESVGQANREGYELDVATQVKASRMGIPEIMYDTLEAPENARVIPREIIPVLLAVRGDSVWVNVEDIKAKMLDSRNSVITSRRFYFNQIGADEESWVDPKDVDATIDPQVKAWRRDPDIDLSAPDAALEVGWVPVKRDDPIVMFFDGGKTDDHTAISGYRLSDGYLFAIGHWGRPSNLDDREPWFAPRTEIDERVQKAMDRFTVVAFWADPSHARDDETDVAYWDDLIDSWHRRYKDRLLLWAVRTGTGQHSVRWDMTSPAHQQTFVQGAEAFQQAMREREVKHDGNAMFVRYMKNAKSYQTKYGTSLWKGSRGSKRKIDGAVTHVGARMLGGLFLNREEREQKKAGYVWGY